MIESNFPKPENNTKEIFPDIAKELIAMGIEDQQMITDVQQKPLSERKWGEQHEQHFLRVKQIISEIGWPTVAKVGISASNTAWLLVQHMDEHLDFQKECLSLMQTEGASNSEIAYLTDRIRVNSGQPQLYGTQYYPNEQGKMVLRPIENEEKLLERRKELGLDINNAS